MVKTYNSRQVTISLGTHAVTGVADDSFIVIEPLGDGVSSKSGCDGEVASAKNSLFSLSSMRLVPKPKA